MIKEIVEFMDLEAGKFRDIILDNRSLAKGLHIIVDKDTFEIKEVAYNDDSDEFFSFVTKYDLKKREYYCQVKGRGGKNFTNNCFDSKYQIHSNSPYAIFYKLKPSNGVFKSDNVNSRFNDFKNKWLDETNYFDKLVENFDDESKEKKNFLENIEKYKNFLNIDFYENNDLLVYLSNLKKDEYIQIYINVSLKNILDYYDFYMQNKVFAKEIFKEKSKKSSMTFNKHICSISNQITNLGLSGFYSSFGDKKPLSLHLTRGKTYGGYASLYSGKVVQSLYFFQELLKLKVLPNPLPIFISSKDAVDNDGNKIYFDLLKDIGSPIKYKEIIKKIYEKLSNNDDKINDLNFYLIFWNLQGGLNIYDVDYIDAFQYKLKNFEISNIFALKDSYSGDIDNIFSLEWGFFSKFFYSLKNEQESTYLLQNNYFTEKINVSKGEEVPSTVATKFYQYNKAIFDYIYKSKQEIINGYMFDDICIPIIREQLKLNDDWDKTYKIKEKLSLYISLYKNFHKGEDLATKIIQLREKMQKLLDNNEVHLENDEEFAYASGQLIWFILSKNESASKTHSLLDIFISKNKIDDFKLIISQQIQKYSHAFKFYDSHSWFDKLVSEVMAYELDKKTIKSLIPLIMAGYFSDNIIVKNIVKKAKENKNGEDSDGK